MQQKEKVDNNSKHALIFKNGKKMQQITWTMKFQGMKKLNKK